MHIYLKLFQEYHQKQIIYIYIYVCVCVCVCVCVYILEYQNLHLVWKGLKQSCVFLFVLTNKLMFFYKHSFQWFLLLISFCFFTILMEVWLVILSSWCLEVVDHRGLLRSNKLVFNVNGLVFFWLRAFYAQLVVALNSYHARIFMMLLSECDLSCANVDIYIKSCLLVLNFDF